MTEPDQITTLAGVLWALGAAAVLWTLWGVLIYRAQKRHAGMRHSSGKRRR